MAYTDKFLPTDELINEINTLKPHISQVALPKFTGAISVSAVPSYELAIKEILIDYAHSTHKEIKKIDNALAANWEEKITEVERVEPSVRSCYQNLIQSRHSYVHANRINLDYDECINDFNIGKKIIEALRSVMV